MERLKYSCHLPRVEGGWVTVAQPSTETEEKVPGACDGLSEQRACPPFHVLKISHTQTLSSQVLESKRIHVWFM